MPYHNVSFCHWQMGTEWWPQPTWPLWVQLFSSESIPGLGRSPGGGSGNQLQYSHLENSMDRVACQATVQGITKESGMTKRLSSMHTLYRCSHGYFPTCSSCNDKDTWGKAWLDPQNESSYPLNIKIPLCWSNSWISTHTGHKYLPIFPHSERSIHTPLT